MVLGALCNIKFMSSLVEHTGESHHDGRCTGDLDNEPVSEFCWHHLVIWDETQQAVGEGWQGFLMMSVCPYIGQENEMFSG